MNLFKFFFNRPVSRPVGTPYYFQLQQFGYLVKLKHILAANKDKINKCYLWMMKIGKRKEAEKTSEIINFLHQRFGEGDPKTKEGN
jgi:hypothetical protein